MTIGSHQKTLGKSQTHITPRWIIDRLGPFDCDPCAADHRPWNCAAVNYVEADDGLSLPWQGRVWLKPPFDGIQAGAWVERLADHGNGILLLHCRVETDWFRPVWQRASAIMFLPTRIKFCKQDGTAHQANSGAPVLLAAFDRGHIDTDSNANRLRRMTGYFLASWESVDGQL